MSVYDRPVASSLRPCRDMHPLDAEMPKQVDQTRLDRAIPVSRHLSRPPEFERPIAYYVWLPALPLSLWIGWAGSVTPMVGPGQ